MGEKALRDLLDRLPEMAEAVNKFEGEGVQREALAALLEAWSEGKGAKPRVRKASPAAEDKDAREGGGEEADQEVVSPEDVNFHPEGKPDFRELADTKKPSNHRERCLLAVYYLKRILGLPKVSDEHIKAAYRNASWKFPSSLKNSLSKTSSKQGWLDTSSMNDIQLKLTGENHVEHDMPESD